VEKRKPGGERGKGRNSRREVRTGIVRDRSKTTRGEIQKVSSNGLPISTQGRKKKVGRGKAN